MAVGRGRVCGHACSCTHLNSYVPALTHFFLNMNIKILFIKRENWSRIRDQSHFDSLFLPLWTVTNFQRSARACREPAQQIPTKARSLLSVSPPASQAPSILIVQPSTQLQNRANFWPFCPEVWAARSTLSTLGHLYEAVQAADELSHHQLDFNGFHKHRDKNLLIQYCPAAISQLMRRHLHLWSSVSHPSAEISTSLTFCLPILALTVAQVHHNLAYWRELLPSIYNIEVALDRLSQADPVYIKQKGRKQTAL